MVPHHPHDEVLTLQQSLRVQVEPALFTLGALLAGFPNPLSPPGFTSFVLCHLAISLFTCVRPCRGQRPAFWCHSHYVGPHGLARFFRLGSKCLYQLSHLHQPVSILCILELVLCQAVASLPRLAG